MAKSALHVLESKERLAAYGQRAIERAELFHIDKVLPQYEAIYLKMTSKGEHTTA
jgi:hypothetical protein